jgi:hypothetical protein
MQWPQSVCLSVLKLHACIRDSSHTQHACPYPFGVGIPAFVLCIYSCSLTHTCLVSMMYEISTHQHSSAVRVPLRVAAGVCPAWRTAQVAGVCCSAVAQMVRPSTWTHTAARSSRSSKAASMEHQQQHSQQVGLPNKCLKLGLVRNTEDLCTHQPCP